MAVTFEGQNSLRRSDRAFPVPQQNDRPMACINLGRILQQEEGYSQIAALRAIPTERYRNPRRGSVEDAKAAGEMGGNSFVIPKTTSELRKREK